jgi:hypothetical protein
MKKIIDEHGRIGRPRMGVDPRERINTTVDAATAAAIDADLQPGESRGQVLDRWAKRVKTSSSGTNVEQPE